MPRSKEVTPQRSTNTIPREWSPKELEELIDARAALAVNARRRQLLNDTGMYVVDGRLDLWKHSNENQARIDGSRIDDLLANSCKAGQRVKIVIITDERLIDALEKES